MAEGQAHLKIEESPQATVVRFADRKILEELSISRIGDELNSLVVDKPGVKLLLSFEEVEHLSSAALGMLITLNKRVAEQSGKLALSDISPQIYEVFKITRLNKVFDIYDDVNQARASL
jgi:anti-sigma B factor antagonist